MHILSKGTLSLMIGKYDRQIISIKINFGKIPNFESADREFLPKVKNLNYPELCLFLNENWYLYPM